MFYHHRHHRHPYVHWFLVMLALVGAYFLGKECQKNDWGILKIQWEDLVSKFQGHGKGLSDSQKPVTSEGNFEPTKDNFPSLEEI